MARWLLKVFRVTNGVRQGGILSPLLFWGRPKRSTCSRAYITYSPLVVDGGRVCGKKNNDSDSLSIFYANFFYHFHSNC